MAIDTLGANALASNSVTTAKVADDAITNAKIDAGAVGTTEVADDAVTGAKIENSPSIANGLTLTDGDVVFATGHGISFAATSDASSMTSELLDDYEEGTWTPTAADAASGGNTTTTGQGRYTKIGRTVILNADIVDINTTGLTNSNTFVIQGLPFANHGTVRATGTMQCNRITNGDDLYAHLSESGSALTFKHNASDGGSTASSIQVSAIADDLSDMLGLTLVYTTN